MPRLGGANILTVHQDAAHNPGGLPRLVPDASRPGHAERMALAIKYAKLQREQREAEKAARMPKAKP